MLTTDFSIRRLVAGDAPAFKRLRLSGLTLYPASFTDAAQSFAEKPESEIAAWINSDTDDEGFILGAFDQNRSLVGILGVARDSAPKLRHRANVWGMFVDPSFQRRGLGRTLLTRTIELCRAGGMIEQLYLGVTTSARNAQALYQQAGFKVVGSEPRKIKIDGTYHGMDTMLLDLVAGAGEQM
jgi:ribosomal protein S18 acetylase RimI-like enzyme